MTNQEQARSFGRKLKELREHTVNPVSNKKRTCLTQYDFSILINELLNDFYSITVIQNWESNLTFISPCNRKLLCGILKVLRQYNGIQTRQQADELLNAGFYAALSDQEAIAIDPEWNCTIKDKPQAEEISTASITNNNLVYITESIVEKKSNLSKIQLGNAPCIPSSFVGREEDISELRARFISPRKGNNSLQVITSIKGWPGVGKTTIASVLAHDNEIVNFFPDGVLWVSLGQKPNLMRKTSTWLTILGVEECSLPKTIEETQSKLISLLRNRQMFLIIDDVWNVEDARPFLVGGAKCATLVTTREDEIANRITPCARNIYRLNVLKDEEALILLNELAPTAVEQYPDECKFLVKELEGLPLAIQVAGRMLNAEMNYGFSIKELIKELKEGASLLNAAAPSDRIDLVKQTTPTIAALLSKSVDQLDDTSRDCYALLGSLAPKPATLSIDAMRLIWQTNDPKPVIKTLVDRGLLEFLPQINRYQIHAIMVMLARTLYSYNNDGRITLDSPKVMYKNKKKVPQSRSPIQATI
jgi:hypothetical protein